ncbi:MAG: hypothetical protein WBE26_01560, partial [Phycisphaerae bacterium]
MKATKSALMAFALVGGVGFAGSGVFYTGQLTALTREAPRSAYGRAGDHKHEVSRIEDGTVPKATGHPERISGPTIARDSDVEDPESVSVPADENTRRGSAPGEIALPQVSALPVNIEVQRYCTGGVCSDRGDAAGEGTLVYSNTLGQWVLGVSASTAYGLMADDIATTAVAGCALDRYTTVVTGDRFGDGSGEGPYSVDIGLYATCPGATLPGDDPPLIPDTDFHFLFEDNGSYAITCQMPAHVDVRLPSNFYLGVHFSRGECGVVVGAPPTLGFSADLYDYPGSRCYAWAGGYPDAAHASFRAEIYVRDECDNAFAGYRNSMQAGNYYAPGAGLRFADYIRLGVPECNVIAYEVAIKGFGLFNFDLRTHLSNSDPENGGVIVGTRGTALSIDDRVQIARVDIDPPISLPPDLWVAFKSSSSIAGPIITNWEASLGASEDFIAVHDGTRWVSDDLGDVIYAAFDISIICEGSPPMGACCDMVLTEDRACMGGENDGDTCTADSDCSDGKCVGESVCREVPEMNCGFPELWRIGETCGAACYLGKNDGLDCIDDTDCKFCQYGEPPDYTYGDPCEEDEDCLEGGVCAGDCVGSFCEGGINDGKVCSRQADCPGYSCAGGPDEGLPCDPDDPDDCPQSYCKRAECDDAFPHSCGLSACCTFDGNCFNLTENECYEHPPMDRPRLYFPGEYCYEGGFCCPWVACLDGEGDCCEAHDTPGCEDPVCCELVCNYWWWDPWWDPYPYGYCCTDKWDEQCVWLAAYVCGCPYPGPPNDECWDPSPVNGARLVGVPSSTESDSLHATEDPTDPGFCCHGGVDCPGGMCCYAGNELCNSSQYGLCVDGERDGKPCDPDPPSPLPGPGSQGYGTVWYKFVAPDTSAELLT